MQWAKHVPVQELMSPAWQSLSAGGAGATRTQLPLWLCQGDFLDLLVLRDAAPDGGIWTLRQLC